MTNIDVCDTAIKKFCSTLHNSECKQVLFFSIPYQLSLSFRKGNCKELIHECNVLGKWGSIQSCCCRYIIIVLIRILLKMNHICKHSVQTRSYSQIEII